jgi:hypothetical protein
MIQPGNAEGFGYHTQGDGFGGGSGGPSPIQMMNAPQASITPHPGIGSSVNYVQGMQNEGRNQAFGTGATEAKGTPSTGGGGMLSKLFGGGGSAEAGAAEGAGAEAASVAEVAAV